MGRESWSVRISARARRCSPSCFRPRLHGGQARWQGARGAAFTPIVGGLARLPKVTGLTKTPGKGFGLERLQLATTTEEPSRRTTRGYAEMRLLRADRRFVRRCRMMT